MIWSFDATGMYEGAPSGGTRRQKLVPRTRKDVITEFRRAEILHAARAVFAARGFERATTADIARAAGIAKGTLYLYYRSKRDVYWAALRHGLQELRRETRRAVNAAGSIEEKIRAFITTKVRYFEDHREFFKIYDEEFGHAVARQVVPREFEAVYLDQVRMLESVLQQAARRKRVRAVRVDAAAFAVFDLTRGLITQRLRGWSKGTLDQDVALVFDLWWKGIAPR